MKICFVDNFSEAGADLLIKALIDRGHKVVSDMSDDVDVIFSASIVKMWRTFEHIQNYPGVPVVTYCWDFYKWAFEGRHPTLNWAKYAELLKRSALIMVPSHAQQLRLKEYGFDSVVIPTCVEVKDFDISEGAYVLDPVRWYHNDPNCYWVKKACEELNIAFEHTEHGLERDAFEKKIANSRFMTCGYVEASTGGLSLIEGLWNGKPSLVSNSPYMGARDYLGDFGTYFQWDDYEDLKKKLHEMYSSPPRIDVEKAREYIKNNFSPQVMAERVERKLCELKKN